jgi:hypothetical protein
MQAHSDYLNCSKHFPSADCLTTAATFDDSFFLVSDKTGS